MKRSVYHQMSKGITCASTVLHDERTAATEIDRVLNGLSKPVPRSCCEIELMRG